MVIFNLILKHRPLTCSHWNVNSLTGQKMIKKSLIEAYNSNHKYDFICISETCLDFSVSYDDKELAMEGYNYIRADHPSNVKKGGVGIYYKELIAVEIININFVNVCYVKSLLIIKRVTLQYSTDLQVKLTLFSMTFFQILKNCFKN